MAPSHALINHARAVEYKPPESAKELLERYAKGEREFPRANLSGANLRHANLRHADLSFADLSGADLSSANLHSADLSGANLSGADLGHANLDNADLSSANLSNANFHRANLSRATLTGANPSNAFFDGADLSFADLRHANLSDAHLNGMDLNGADLSGADLRGANLRGANLVGTDFCGTNLGGAILGSTILARVSLIEICKADPPAKHYGPSIIDFESITLSLLAPNLEDFLIRAGIPHIAAQYMIESAQAVKGSVWDMMQSVFISFGGPDEPFARKLYEALHSNGVRTFFFPEHAEPGKPLHRLMRDAVKEHDRVVLVCSKNSLTRNGVLVEIEESLRRESKQGGEMILIPITIDDFIYGDKDGNQWQPPDPGTRDAILARVVADFRGLDKDPAKFSVEVSKLIRALRVKNPAPTTP